MSCNARLFRWKQRKPDNQCGQAGNRFCKVKLVTRNGVMDMRPEILAPAGSMEALKAAVHAGADAVYLGGSRFGARAYADNFDETALIQAIEYAHLYGVKVYLTINTLFRNEEITQLFDYLSPLYQAGLDAVIVQDLGVMCYVHQNFPDLPIHASTQMTITTEYAYSLLKDYGVVRIVPARELSLQEIKRLKEGPDIPEVEVFVQGALCYCYSGQCLMSSMLGGRSGNRGRCAQTCRLPYLLYDKKGDHIDSEGAYLLSLKDLCGLEAVPDLIEAGVDSFKIEGRMKKAEYVAACVRAYRSAVDAWYEGEFSKNNIEKYKDEMAQVYNRGGFTKGYYHRKNGRDMMSVKAPGNVGVTIGNIVDIRKNRIWIKLQKDVHKEDIFVLEGKKEQITLTCNIEGKSGTVIILNASRTQELHKNQSVTRMFHKPLMEELKNLCSTDKKLPLWGKLELMTGSPAALFLSMRRGNSEQKIVCNGSVVEKAEARPLSEEVVQDKVGKIGNTRYYFEKLDINISEGAFYPLKELKELRREAINILEQAVKEAYRRQPPIRKDMIFEKESSGMESDTSVMVSDLKQFNLVKCEKRIKNIYLDLQYFQKEVIISLLEEKKDCYIVLPPVLRTVSLKEMKELPITKIKGVVVRNIDELAYLKHIEYRGQIVADYSLYAMNDYAAYFMRTLFSDIRITVPAELNQKQMNTLCYMPQISELEVYGYKQLMISAQCLQSTLAGCRKDCAVFNLQDRLHKSFKVSCICKYCYNLIYNGVPTVLFDLNQRGLIGSRVKRLHFTEEDEEEVMSVLHAFFGGSSMEGEKTRGHYNRGVE